VVVMSIKKLAAGSGYDYLIKQVAVQDATLPAGGLTSYYSERGEAPGVWVGYGLASLGLAPGDPVTAEQMEFLFGAGEHPLAGQLRAEAAADGQSRSEILKAGRIGRPFRVWDTTPNVFLDELADRCKAWNAAAGQPVRAHVPDEVRAQLRTDVGRDLFRRTFGRDPLDVAELQGAIAAWSKRAPEAVAGFDESFSPPKSVSVLWALADPQVAALVERCHLAAVRDALAYQETKAFFTREGTDGVRQVDTRGMVAVSFTHRTHAPATPTCTPMSQSRTRPKPSKAAGTPPTAGRSSKATCRPRKPTTRSCAPTSPQPWACDGPPGQARTGNGQYGRSTASTPAFARSGHHAVRTSKTGRPSWRPSSGLIMVGRRPRWR